VVRQMYFTEFGNHPMELMKIRIIGVKIAVINGG